MTARLLIRLVRAGARGAVHGVRRELSQIHLERLVSLSTQRRAAEQLVRFMRSTSRPEAN